MKKYLIWIPFIGIFYFKLILYKKYPYWMLWQLLTFSMPMAILLGKVFTKNITP